MYYISAGCSVNVSLIFLVQVQHHSSLKPKVINQLIEKKLSINVSGELIRVSDCGDEKQFFFFET